VRTPIQSPAGSGVGAVRDISVVRTGSVQRGDVEVDLYTASMSGDGASRLPRALAADSIARANGGRLPIGLRPEAGGTPVNYDDRNALTVSVAGDRVVGLDWRETVTGTVALPSGGSIALRSPVLDRASGLPAAVAAGALRQAARDADRTDTRDVLSALAWSVGVMATLALAAGGALTALRRRRADVTSPAVVPPVGEMVRN
jgi:hypothetical protein